jgi:hypothetical protein
MSHPDATIVYDKEASTLENRLVLSNSAVKDIIGVSLSNDFNNSIEMTEKRIDTPIIRL